MNSCYMTVIKSLHVIDSNHVGPKSRLMLYLKKNIVYLVWIVQNKVHTKNM